MGVQRSISFDRMVTRPWPGTCDLTNLIFSLVPPLVFSFNFFKSIIIIIGTGSARMRGLQLGRHAPKMPGLLNQLIPEDSAVTLPWRPGSAIGELKFFIWQLCILQPRPSVI
mmetsp:Transcript_53765/g.128118  ORF Transcript_53765/g.128118 Transcript_53765/m.128118 type:complete len:112 (-) Transcript_53765:298-633(-)